MASLDVEALLDSTAKSSTEKKPKAVDEERSRDGRPDRRDKDSERDRDRDRDGSRTRDRERERDRDYDRRRRDRRDHSLTRSRRGSPGADTPRSDAGSYKSRRRSRSRDDDRRHSRRHRDGDYYRGGRGGRSRSRSRSPPRNYRPREDRDRRDRRDRSDRQPQDHGRGRDDDRREARPDGPAPLTEDERDRRTVFVQQLAARLRTRELKEFFEKVGPVNEAQIVKDRVSQRSKG